MKKVYPVPEHWSKKAYINKEKYDELYRRSIEDPDSFWEEQAQRLHWSKTWDRVKNTRFDSPVEVKWFEGGELNACYNCVDRHAKNTPDRVALLWEPDAMGDSHKEVTYQQLLEEVSRMANALKEGGVKKGDRVTLYLPMIPEAVYAMLACARIGAIHSVVFAGFSASALADRLQDCESSFLVTADEGLRGGKTIPLKEKADEAMNKVGTVKRCFVVKHTQKEGLPWDDGRDLDLKNLMQQQSGECPPEAMSSEDPLFILYTSGSTSKPKGVLHTTGGYLTYTSLTFETIFDYHPEDTYWCAADIGWVTGHSYIVYGPLSVGATQVLFEGVPTHPDSSRIWQIVDKFKVNTLYTAPTLLRALMRDGDEPLKETSRESLRLLGSVGEPINAEAWHWYYESVGQSRCPIVDTWWQTETGGVLLSPLPGATDLKPSSACKPFFGVQPALVDEKGNEISGAGEGRLCFKESWPGQMRTVYKNHHRFEETYFSQVPGMYFSGDGARRDEDGDYWVTGRMDDVINISGHRLGTAEVESAIDNHRDVAESAVVGFQHPIKGQGLFAFVTLKKRAQPNEDMKKQLIDQVRQQIGPLAQPDHIQWSPQLPKTRSGKIMRRILRKIAAKEYDQLGDVSTLADPSVVESLIAEHRHLMEA